MAGSKKHGLGTTRFTVWTLLVAVVGKFNKVPNGDCFRWPFIASDQHRAATLFVIVVVVSSIADRTMLFKGFYWLSRIFTYIILMHILATILWLLLFAAFI